MATHPTKLIAWTPRLHTALTNLTKGIGTTRLKQQEIQPKPQSVIPSAETPQSIRLGAVVTMPTGGAGVGAVYLATPTVSGGIIVDSGASISVIMPYLDGAN